MAQKPPRPLDITENNTPIDKGAPPPKGKCGCGGKGDGSCKTGVPMISGGGCCNTWILKTIWVVIFSAAVILAGCMIGRGIASISGSQRVVSVRGFAERAVKADLAIWNIYYVATGDDLLDVQEKIEADSDKIRAFLKQNGLTDTEILEQPTSMVDLLSREYRTEGASKGRYIVNAGLRVRSDKVDLVQSLSGMKIGALIKAGVTLRDNQQPPVYVYTRLKDVKPEMIAEATEDARKAAEQFAKDSGAKLSGMKTASQGVFQFLPRDQADGVMESSEINKTVRVVTSTEYLLAN